MSWKTAALIKRLIVRVIGQGFSHVTAVFVKEEDMIFYVRLLLCICQRHFPTDIPTLSFKEAAQQITCTSTHQIFLKFLDVICLAINYNLLMINSHILTLKIDCFTLSLCRALHFKEINIV